LSTALNLLHKLHFKTSLHAFAYTYHRPAHILGTHMHTY